MGDIGGTLSPEQREADERRARRRVRNALVISLVLLALLFWQAPSMPLVAFAAVLLAVVLRGFGVLVHRVTRLPTRPSLVIATVIFVAALVGFGWLFFPRVADQIEELAERLPQLFEDASVWLRQRSWGRWLMSQLGGGGNDGGGGGSELLGRLTGAFSSTVNAVTYLVLILITGIYLAAEADRYVRGALLLLPPDRRPRAAEVLESMGHALRYWMLGQMVSMTFLAVFAFIGLRLLDVPLALTLALLTGILTFIPNLGAIISVFPPVLIALSQFGLTRALAVLAFYVALQNLEGYFITPMVQRRAVSLPPALLLFAQVLMAILFGALGLLLAAPFMAVVLVGVKMMYLEDVLGERGTARGALGREP